MGSLTAGFAGFAFGVIATAIFALVFILMFGTAFLAMFGVSTGFGVAQGVANNTDAVLSEQPDGDIIMYVPNASNTTGYQAVLIYENSSSPMQATNMSPTTNKNTASILTKTPISISYI